MNLNAKKILLKKRNNKFKKEKKKKMSNLEIFYPIELKEDISNEF
jgi:hypothetical protein